MDKQEIIRFFDRLAPTWDETLVDRDAVIAVILDNARVAAGQDVLDVACGTGVLFDHYLRRGVRSVTGVDISPAMARIAAAKYAANPAVRVVCGDIEETAFDRAFDRVVVYNALPHFPDARRLIARLADLVRPGGLLTVAHGFSREAINAHHRGAAARVSTGLMPVEDLRALMAPLVDVCACVSDGEMYQVAGVKRG